MSRELIQRIISEETREVARVGRQLFSEDPNTQSEALAQIVLIRESIIKLLGMLGTPRAGEIAVELRYRDPVYLLFMVRVLLGSQSTRSAADSLSRYLSTLPFVSAAISENQSPELRIRNFTRDALPIIPDEEKSPRILRKELCDIQTDIDSMIQLLEKPIRFKKKRTQCVIDFLHLRIRLEDICTVMFQQGNFIDASSDADIHSCIRESRDDLDLLGTIVCDIIYDGVSPIAREIAERLQKWAWIVQKYIPQK